MQHRHRRQGRATAGPVPPQESWGLATTHIPRHPRHPPLLPSGCFRPSSSATCPPGNRNSSFQPPSSATPCSPCHRGRLLPAAAPTQQRTMTIQRILRAARLDNAQRSLQGHDTAQHVSPLLFILLPRGRTRTRIAVSTNRTAPRHRVPPVAPSVRRPAPHSPILRVPCIQQHPLPGETPATPATLTPCHRRALRVRCRLALSRDPFAPGRPAVHRPRPHRPPKTASPSPRSAEIYNRFYPSRVVLCCDLR
ncbi:hypothetical protein CALVIDRAFT_16220 [Calocera viscosa TUFC12733]|uniref:Uncharacterized protein n=1 Tax=Calocera viscosa (strain TUFC12733) TaxID=1330018 RepID=A0A167S9K3_CALVF|nr:hypothetical protein CALVIDRAFT_16220 [Calocera viscosa TUFC12733]